MVRDYPTEIVLLIYWHFNTAVQNRDLLDASTPFHDLSNFCNVKTGIFIFLLVDVFVLLSRLSRAKYAFPISTISLSESNSSHLSETDWDRPVYTHYIHVERFFICYFKACLSNVVGKGSVPLTVPEDFRSRSCFRPISQQICPSWLPINWLATVISAFLHYIHYQHTKCAPIRE